MDLTRPTDHQRAYPWAAVLLAHAFIGQQAAQLLHSLMPMWAAVCVVALVYAVVWEGAVQRLGAGLMDAAIDTAAVTAGALLAWAAQFIAPSPTLAVLALFGVILAGGIWRRQ